MSIESLEDKYKDQLEVLKNLPEEVTALNVCLLLKNFIGAAISPLGGDEKILHQFMELFAVDLDALGYSLTRNETAEVPDTDEGQTEEDSLASDAAIDADENAQPGAPTGTIE